MVHRRSNIDDQTLGLVANLLEHRQLPDLDLSEPRWTHEKIAEACSVGRTTVRRVEENLCLFQQPKRPRLGPDKGTVSSSYRRGMGLSNGVSYWETCCGSTRVLEYLADDFNVQLSQSGLSKFLRRRR